MTEDQLAEAHRAIMAGERCIADVIAELDHTTARQIELAVHISQKAAEEGRPVENMLHWTTGRRADKAAVAAMLCPGYVHEWAGDIDQRNAGYDAWRQREQDIIDDRVLANEATFDPDDRSEAATYVREVAASVRDHREAHWRRIEREERDEEAALLTEARDAYTERDRLQAEADSLGKAGNWDASIVKSVEARQANKRGDEVTLEAVPHHNAALKAQQESDALAAARHEYNQKYGNR